MQKQFLEHTPPRDGLSTEHGNQNRHSHGLLIPRNRQNAPPFFRVTGAITNTATTLHIAQHRLCPPRIYGMWAPPYAVFSSSTCQNRVRSGRSKSSLRQTTPLFATPGGRRPSLRSLLCQKVTIDQEITRFLLAAFPYKNWERPSFRNPTRTFSQYHGSGYSLREMRATHKKAPSLEQNGGAWRPTPGSYEQSWVVCRR